METMYFKHIVRLVPEVFVGMDVLFFNFFTFNAQEATLFSLFLVLALYICSIAFYAVSTFFLRPFYSCYFSILFLYLFPFISFSSFILFRMSDSCSEISRPGPEYI